MPKYILHYREIIVTPIVIEANNLEEAVKLVQEGEFEESDIPEHKDAYPASLSFDDFSSKVFEAGYIAAEYENGEVVVEQKELDWSELNSHWD